MTSLQQVLVHFETVVARVSHNDIAIISYRETLRTVERISRRVDKRQERTLGIKNLHSNKTNRLHVSCLKQKHRYDMVVKYNPSTEYSSNTALLA